MFFSSPSGISETPLDRISSISSRARISVLPSANFSVMERIHGAEIAVHARDTHGLEFGAYLGVEVHDHDIVDEIRMVAQGLIHKATRDPEKAQHDDGTLPFLALLFVGVPQVFEADFCEEPTKAALEPVTIGDQVGGTDGEP